MRVALHFEKAACGGKRKHTEGERDKKEVIICEYRPRFGKQNSAQKKTCTAAYIEACGLMGLMWALGWLGKEHRHKIETRAKQEADINQLQKWS